MSSGTPMDEGLQVEDLTWREQEILLLLAERCSNREIADQLRLAESTVKDYISNIISKLYVKNRRQAVERARDLGWLNGPGIAKPTERINLPAEPTPFAGRSEELLEIQRQLGETRLLTLLDRVGSGRPAWR